MIASQQHEAAAAVEQLPILEELRLPPERLAVKP